MVETIELLIRERKELKSINNDIKVLKEKISKTKASLKNFKAIENEQNKTLKECEFEIISIETIESVSENFIEYCKNRLNECIVIKSLIKENIINYKANLK